MINLRIIKNYVHKNLAILANIFYRFPSRGMTIIGVTGTDGKTTTSNLIYHILCESGKKVAVISTVGAIINGKKFDTGFHVTTPSPFAIQKYLYIAKKEGCKYVVLEVTSHALDQNRVWGIRFDIGVLTNITHEHLDYHKTYFNYMRAKFKLFKMSKITIANSNGEWFDELKKTIKKDNLITYSLYGKNIGDISLNNIPFKIKTTLMGDFNLENILAAYAVAKYLGIDIDTISAAIQTYSPPPGRQEILRSKKGVTIIIDFAHTPNSFEKMLPEVRKITVGKIIHVFGAAGERDRGKRSEMGKIASFYDDVIILTAEDPRSESLRDINSQIKKGIGKEFAIVNGTLAKKVLHEIDDREKAIEYALSIASKNDTVIITGKGHENSINYGNGEIPWSDKKVVLDYLSKRNEI